MRLLTIDFRKVAIQPSGWDNRQTVEHCRGAAVIRQASVVMEQPKRPLSNLSYASILGITVVNHSVVCLRSLAVRIATAPVARSKTGQAIGVRQEALGI